jgi:hypothetical protein
MARVEFKLTKPRIRAGEDCDLDRVVTLIDMQDFNCL